MSILYTYPEYVRPQMLQNQVLSIYGCPQAESAQLSQGQQCLPTSPFELRGIIRRARSIELRGNFCFAQYGRMIIWRYGHETASIPGLNLGPGLKLEALRTLPSHTGRLTESSNASLLLYICGEFFPPSPTFTHPRKSRVPFLAVRLFLRPDYSILNLNRPPFFYNSYQISVHTLSVKMADSSKPPTSTGGRPPSSLAEAAKAPPFPTSRASSHYQISTRSSASGLNRPLHSSVSGVLYKDLIDSSKAQSPTSERPKSVLDEVRTLSSSSTSHQSSQQFRFGPYASTSPDARSKGPC